MKISNLIVVTVLAGSMILFIAAGKEQVNNNKNYIDEYILNDELDVLIAKELGEDIKYEDVFGDIRSESIEPKDILDIEEEKEIIVDVEVEKFLPQDFNPYCG